MKLKRFFEDVAYTFEQLVNPTYPGAKTTGNNGSCLGTLLISVLASIITLWIMNKLGY